MTKGLIPNFHAYIYNKLLKPILHTALLCFCYSGIQRFLWNLTVYVSNLQNGNSWVLHNLFFNIWCFTYFWGLKEIKTPNFIRTFERPFTRPWYYHIQLTHFLAILYCRKKVPLQTLKFFFLKVVLCTVLQDQILIFFSNQRRKLLTILLCLSSRITMIWKWMSALYGLYIYKYS